MREGVCESLLKLWVSKHVQWKYEYEKIVGVGCTYIRYKYRLALHTTQLKTMINAQDGYRIAKYFWKKVNNSCE